MRVVAVVLLASCAASEAPSREQRILEVLSDDNFVAANRNPELVAFKLKKMQRGPFEWLRGTALLYWRDLMEPGDDRLETTFGDPESAAGAAANGMSFGRPPTIFGDFATAAQSKGVANP